MAQPLGHIGRGKVRQPVSMPRPPRPRRQKPERLAGGGASLGMDGIRGPPLRLAACRHWSVPVPRQPLSSQWTTGSTARHWSCTGALAGLTAAALSWVAATRGPSPTGGPERAAHIARVLSQGINCSGLQYTACAFRAGPYGPGGVPAGGQAPLVVCPQCAQGVLLARGAVPARRTSGSSPHRPSLGGTGGHVPQRGPPGPTALDRRGLAVVRLRHGVQRMARGAWLSAPLCAPAGAATARAGLLHALTARGLAASAAGFPQLVLSGVPPGLGGEEKGSQRPHQGPYRGFALHRGGTDLC